MDLGIRGRTAIVCASSQGLGKACAAHSPRPACRWSSTAAIARRSNKPRRNPPSHRRHRPSRARRRIHRRRPGRAARRLPHTDILINNNGGPRIETFANSIVPPCSPGSP